MKNLKSIVPEIDKMFGTLTFAGAGEETSRRVNGRNTVVSRDYHLYSEKLLNEDVIVRIPARAGVKNYAYEEEVKVLVPKIEAFGRVIQGRGYADYIIVAEDLVKA